MAGDLSEEVERQLVADGVLAAGECADPRDLPSLVDLVAAKFDGRQATFVSAMRPNRFRNATPNEGYRVAVALMLEGVIRSFVTLNFDLAMNHAIAELGAGDVIATLAGPEDWAHVKDRTLIYLHRNIDSDPEALVLRASQLDDDWRESWQQIVATAALAVPVSVFVGLGSPTPVLAETAAVIRSSLDQTETYLVGPGNLAQNAFGTVLAIGEDHYVSRGWGSFMRALSDRALAEHQIRCTQRAQEIARENGEEPVDIAPVLQSLAVKGICAVGLARGRWLYQTHQYVPLNLPLQDELAADLLTAVRRIETETGSQATLEAAGTLEFRDGSRVVGRAALAAGGGTRTKAAVLARVAHMFESELASETMPSVIITSGVRATPVGPAPFNITDDTADSDVIGGSREPRLLTVDEIRDSPSAAFGSRAA